MESASFFILLHELIMNHYPVKYMEKGRYLFQESTLSNELFYIVSGKAQVNKIVPDGREFTMKLCGPHSLVGESILFSKSKKHMMNAKMFESGEVAVINKEAFEQQISNNHSLSIEFMEWLSTQYCKTQTKFRDLMLHGKKGALYSTIIRLSNSYGVETENGLMVSVPLTNQELANFCGTSREVVNRLLAELRKNKVVTIEKGHLYIHNLQFLRQEIDCENCPIELCKIE